MGLNRFTQVAEGDGWREECTGLHPNEFIETHRHWFSKPVTHHTNNSVNVLNLVEGEEAVIESPINAFKPFVVHYAETFDCPTLFPNIGNRIFTYTCRDNKSFCIMHYKGLESIYRTFYNSLFTFH